MATLTINGKRYTGKNIEVINSRVIIDGIEVGNDFTSPLEVRVLEGFVQEIKADGSVMCGHVGGNVSAGGSVNCDAVDGNVSAGGSVNCDDVGGHINAGGSVRRG